MRPPIGILCNLTEGDRDPHRPWDRCVHAYSAAVLAGGGIPLLIPCMDEPNAIAEALGTVRGVIITGGVDVHPAHYGQEPHHKLGPVSPERDFLDREVVRYALAHRDFPVLAICRGIQALNVFAGGTLIQDIPTQVANALIHDQQTPESEGAHCIEIARHTELARTIGAEPLRVNSYHHQAVRDVAPGFAAVAWSQDGVVEAIERQGARFCIGVQFHPELMWEREERISGLFVRLVREAGGSL